MSADRLPCDSMAGWICVLTISTLYETSFRIDGNSIDVSASAATSYGTDTKRKNMRVKLPEPVGRHYRKVQLRRGSKGLRCR